MEESILTTIKNMLEIDLDDDCFDEELITYINTCFITLKQVGAIDYDFYIADKTTSWADLLKDKACIHLAYLTGILPIKKYGTHSALNICSC